MKAMTVLCEVEKNRRERWRISLGSSGGYRIMEVQLVEELTASSGIFVPEGRPLTLRIEKLPEFIAGLVSAVQEADARGWIVPNSLERAGLRMRAKT